MIIEDLKKLQPLIEEFVEKWNALWEDIRKVLDVICDEWDEFCIEIQKRFPACRNQRYLIAKKIPKCTSMESKKVYRAFRPIYFARGSC